VTPRFEFLGESLHQAQFLIIESHKLRVNPQRSHRNYAAGRPGSLFMRFNKALLLFSYSSFHLYRPTLTIQDTHNSRVRPDENRDME
jgi:hypothetical protein